MKNRLIELAERFKGMRIDPEYGLCMMTPECRDVIVKQLEEMVEDLIDQHHEWMERDR